MKNVIVLILSLILLGNMAYSIDLEFGIDFGGRTVSEREIKNVYGGTEFIYCPYISVNITDRLTLGIGYEGGPRSEGSIGIYNEKSTFKISGFEVFNAIVFITLFVPLKDRTSSHFLPPFMVL